MKHRTDTLHIPKSEHLPFVYASIDNICLAANLQVSSLSVSLPPDPSLFQLHSLSSSLALRSISKDLKSRVQPLCEPLHAWQHFLEAQSVCPNEKNDLAIHRFRKLDMIRSWCWHCNTARPWYSLASGAQGNGMISSLPHVVCTYAKDHTVFSLTLKISPTWKAEAGVQNFPKTSAVCKEVASSNSWLTNPASVLPSWSGEEISCMAHAHEETIVLDLHVISCEDAFQAWHSRHMQCPTNENFLGLVTERAFCRKKNGRRKHLLVSWFFLYLVRFWSKYSAGICRPWRCHMAHEDFLIGATTAISCWHGIQDHLHHLKRPTPDTWNGRRNNMKKQCPASISKPRFQPTNGTAIWTKQKWGVNMIQRYSKWFKSQVLSCRPTFEAASEQIAMKSQHQLSSRLTILFRDLTQMNDPLPS